MDMQNVTDAIQNLSLTHPWVITFLTFLGVLRTVMKPLMSIINGYAIFAPTAQANAIREVEASDAYLWLVWTLDYVASIKLPGTAQLALKRSKSIARKTAVR